MLAFSEDGLRLKATTSRRFVAAASRMQRDGQPSSPLHEEDEGDEEETFWDVQSGERLK